MTIHYGILLLSLVLVFVRLKSLVVFYGMSKFFDGSLTRKEVWVRSGVLYFMLYVVLLGPFLIRGGSWEGAIVVLSIFVAGGILGGGLLSLMLRTYDDPVIRVPRPSLKPLTPATVIAMLVLLEIPLILVMMGAESWPLTILGAACVPGAWVLWKRALVPGGEPS